MKGIAQIVENEVATMIPEKTTTLSTTQSLSTRVNDSLDEYFAQLDGQMPSKLYARVIAEVEKPLIRRVLKLTNGNQSKAAVILEISRGTLRKKMAMYGIK